MNYLRDFGFLLPQIGDVVRVSSSVPEPSRGWAGVNGSSVGKVVKIKGTAGHEDVVVDFPECKNWIASPTELEMSRELTTGDKVQVMLLKVLYKDNG